MEGLSNGVKAMKQRIKDLIVKRVMTCKENLSETLMLREQGFTSLMFVELILALEEEFGIEIPDEDLTPDHFSSIPKIAEYIQRRMAHTEKAEDMKNGTN
jgi:acyl carrier protein